MPTHVDDLKNLLTSGAPVVVDGVLYNMDAPVAAWVNEKLGGGLVPTLARAFGVVREGINDPPDSNDIPAILIAGAYFFNWYDTGSSFGTSDITVAVYSDDVAAGRPDVIRAILAFPFGQLGCRRITFEIDMTNTRAIRQITKLGAILEGRKRKMSPGGGDVGIFGLLPDECPIWRDRT